MLSSLVPESPIFSPLKHTELNNEFGSYRQMKIFLLLLFLEKNEHEHWLCYQRSLITLKLYFKVMTISNCSINISSASMNIEFKLHAYDSYQYQPGDTKRCVLCMCKHVAEESCCFGFPSVISQTENQTVLFKQNLGPKWSLPLRKSVDQVCGR